MVSSSETRDFHVNTDDHAEDGKHRGSLSLLYLTIYF